MKIGLIGCGKLGKAFVRALTLKGVSDSARLSVVEKDTAQVKSFVDEFKLELLSVVDDRLRYKEALIFAVKPQDFEVMCKEVAPFVGEDQLLLSVMTGIKIERISKAFGGANQIVRSMPNLPAQVGYSVTPFTCHPELTESNREKALRIISAIGTYMELSDESLMNAVTALSATGPGYVYEIISHMIKAGEEMGFTHQQCCSLIAETFNGSIALWRVSGKSVEELRDAVKSKGGTTEAALKRFELGDFGRTLREGILAAYRRAVELGTD